MALDAAQARRVLQALDGALRVFRIASGRLTVADIRVQSMLSVARKGIEESLRAAENGAAAEETASRRLMVDGFQPPNRPDASHGPDRRG